MKTYAFVYFGAALIAQLVTPLVSRAAKAAGLVDQPGVRKIHASPVPRIGGVAITVAVLAATLPVLALDNTIGEAFRHLQTALITLLAAGVFMFALGLIDDIRGMSSRVKLVALLLCALAVCASGARIQSVSLENWFYLELGWLSWPLTVLWIAGVTVGINFIDGLDGLAAGIAAIVCGAIAIFALASGQAVMAVLMLAMLGGLSGFLFFNYNPAKIFMGDCGSMFLGFIIGAGSVVSAAKTSTLVGIALPALALGVPILDTAFTLVRRRVLDRRSIFAAERGHIHHRLIDMGLRQRQAVIIIHLITLAGAGMGLLMLVARREVAVAVPVVALALLLLVFTVVGSVRLKETLLALRRNHAIASRARHEKHCFENMQLRIRETRSFDGWWETVCHMADEMDFAGLSLNLTEPGQPACTRVWHSPRAEPFCQEALTMIVPVRNGQAGAALRMEVAVRVDGSLEGAGRRISWFGRLIDERPLVNVPYRPTDLDQPAFTASAADATSPAESAPAESHGKRLKLQPEPRAVPVPGAPQLPGDHQ